ncbi:GNAT family N-acetyltransferase [Streptomyces sp. NPDC014894]|uniref:GNAT family N-acetyltransferase n=1 Tax=unclassified Streptomyces TaxID=2593676 RepID=UPI003702339A
MDHDETLALFDRLTRRDAVADSPGARVERVGPVVRQTGGANDWNGVLWSDLDAGTADAAIAAQIAHFAALGRDIEWKLYSHDLPVDLGERLEAAGFAAEPAETLMVVEAAALDTSARPPEGVRLVDVTDAAGVELMIRAQGEAFGDSPPRLREQLLGQLGLDTSVLTVALAGDRPVCGARTELDPASGFAGLWGGGTVPDWRGRGVYRAMVAHRARIALARDHRHLRVDASDESRPILERLGFTALSTTTPYLLPAPAARRAP